MSREQVIALSRRYQEKNPIELEGEPEKFPSLSTINEVVARYYGLSMAEFYSHRRKELFVKARFIAMYFARKMTIRSFPMIGRLLHRDHSTVIYGADKIEVQLQTDTDLAREIEEIRIAVIAATFPPAPMEEVA